MSVLVLILPSSSQIQNPEQLARTGQGRLAQERSTDVAELEVLRQREMAEKRTRALQRSNRWVRGALLCSRVTAADTQHGPVQGWVKFKLSQSC